MQKGRTHTHSFSFHQPLPRTTAGRKMSNHLLHLLLLRTFVGLVSSTHFRGAIIMTRPQPGGEPYQVGIRFMFYTVIIKSITWISAALQMNLANSVSLAYIMYICTSVVSPPAREKDLLSLGHLLSSGGMLTQPLVTSLLIVSLVPSPSSQLFNVARRKV